MDLSSPPALEHPPAFLDAVLREPVTAGEDLPVDARDLRPELSDRLVASDRPFEFLLLADPEFADPSPAALALDEDCGLMRLAPRAAAALLPAASAKELEASLYYLTVTHISRPRGARQGPAENLQKIRWTQFAAFRRLSRRTLNHTA